MADQKLITAEEYKAAINSATWAANGGYLLPGAEKRQARVLLALDGAWREVPECFRESYGDARYTKAEVAARHGLPVDHVADSSKLIKPCPECGGVPLARGYPCPACQEVEK